MKTYTHREKDRGEREGDNEVENGGLFPAHIKPKLDGPVRKLVRQ